MTRADILEIVTPGRGAEMVGDLRYISYCMTRLLGVSAETLAKHYPRADKFEAEYQREVKAGTLGVID